MKTPVILILAFSASLLPVRADDDASPDVAAIGMLPNQRTAQRLGANERNPFAFKPKEPAKVAVEETETQESKIRALFKLMNVSGVRRGTDGKLVALVGDLILREGEEVKQVLPEQTESLMVSRIEPKKIELTFVENKDSTQPRTIVLPIVGQTRVAERLSGQPKGGKAMYFPRLRAAAAGVAALLSTSGGSGGHPASHAAPEASGESAELSGIGAITAPVPSGVERPEQMSFAALAPPGSSPGARGSVPATPGGPARGAGPAEPGKAPPAGSGNSTAPGTVPTPASPAPPPRALPAVPPLPKSAPPPQPARPEPQSVPPPARPASAGSVPAPAPPIAAPMLEATRPPAAVPNAATPPPPAAPKPIRLTVPPPPASQAPPVVE
jgi:hypothetical protein